MAILDVFTLLFDSDARNLEKGNKAAEESTDKVKKTISATDKAAKSLGQSFLSIVTDARGRIAGLLSVGAIAAGVINEAARTNQLGLFSEAIGANIEDLDAWGRIIEKHGGTAEGFQSTVKGLTSSLTEMALTGGGPAVEAFARLGISAFDAQGQLKSAFDLLPEIADSFEGLSDVETLALGQQLGLDQATILTLRQGRLGVKELVAAQKELGVTTQQDFEAAQQFNQSWQDLRRSFSLLITQIGTELLPAFSGIVDVMRQVVGFFQENKELITLFFIGAAATITKIYLPTILKALAATVATYAPLFAIGAVVTAVAAAFALLAEDVFHFIQGNDSLIGQFLDKYPIIGDTLKAVFEWSKFFYEALLSIVKVLGGPFLKGLSKAFSAARKLLGIGKGKDSEVVEISEEINRAFNGDEETPDGKATRAMSDAERNPIVASNPNAITNKSTEIQRNNTVSIQNLNVDATGGDSAEIANNVDAKLRDQFQHTASNYDDGVMI